MATYTCLTHGITVIVEENRRDFINVPEAVPPCQLFLMPEFKEGRFGECEVKRL